MRSDRGKTSKSLMSVLDSIEVNDSPLNASQILMPFGSMERTLVRPSWNRIFLIGSP